MKAEDYCWSSAAAHCEMRGDTVLTTKAPWKKQLATIGNWSAWLAEGDQIEDMSMIRRNIEKGLPCGSDRFIKKLEKRIGRILQYRPVGRPRKERDN